MTPARNPASADGVWRRRADASWRRSLDAVVLLPSGTEEPIVLPGTAAAVWDLLHEPRDQVGLVARLVDAYDADAGTVERDVVALLAHLESLGAVERG